MNRVFTLTLAALPLLMLGCTSPEDPQASICQKMASKVAERSNISWEAPKKTEAAQGQLQVDLFSADLNATCWFDRQPPEPDSGVHTLTQKPWETSPNRMTVNGAPVDSKSFAAALFDATGKIFAESVEETKQIVDEQSAIAKEKLGEAAAMAKEKGAEALDAAKEKIQELQNQ